MSADDGRPIFDGLVEYPLPAKPGVKDYVVYCGDNLAGYGKGAKAFFDKHYPNHVVKTANTLQDVMAALQADVASNGVTQIRELVLVTHANANQLFFPVVPAGAGVDSVYGCITAWSLAQLQNDIEAKFASFDQARKAVVPLLLDDSWVTVRGCNFGNSAEGLYALHSFFGGRANVYAPTKFMVFADSPIQPGNRIDSKFAVYDYLVKQHFLSSREHTPKRQAAIVTDLVDPEFFAQPVQLATAQFTGGDLTQAAAYQQLVDELNHYQVSADLTAAFAAASRLLSASPLVVSASDTSVNLSSVPTGPRSVWYVRDSALSDGAESVDLVYQIRDETDAGGTSTLAASAQLAVTSTYASLPVQLFFDQLDDDAFNGVVARLAGYADEGPFAGQQYESVFNAITQMLDSGTWTDGTNDVTADVNSGLVNAGFDSLPDPLPPVNHPDASEDAWTSPGPPPLAIGVELTSAPDGSPLHTIVVRLDLDQPSLTDIQKGVIQARGRVPDTPGTEIAAYLDGLTADQLASLIDYLRSAYRPAYSYYVAHALAAITRKRDFLTWAAAQPDATDPLPAHLMLRSNENNDLRSVAFTFDFNDNWREVKQHSKYTATVQSDLFQEGSLTTKLLLTGTWTCGVLPPDSRYFSRAELQAAQSQGFQQYFAAQSKTVFEPKPAQVDQGCADFQAALQKWKELRDAGATAAVQQQTLEDLKGEDGLSAWERMKETLEPLHMGTELWDMVLEPGIEYRAVALEFASEWFDTNIESDWLREWLVGSFDTTGEILEVVAWIKVPFDMWMDFAKAQAEAAATWDTVGQIVAIRQWLRKLIELTFQVPFPAELHVDIGGAAQAHDSWIAEQQEDYEHPRYSLDTFTLFEQDLEDGYARAADSFGRIGPGVVDQANKYLDETIAKSGLSPCSLKAMTDVGLYDRDDLRRRIIRRFAEAVLDSVPPVP